MLDPTKNVGPIGLAVLTFIGYKQTNKQTNKQTDKTNLYIDKVVISVCLFVCPIITHKPLDRVASNLNSRESEECTNFGLNWVGFQVNLGFQASLVIIIIEIKYLP